MKLGDLIEKIESAASDVFWRVADRHVDLFNTNSVEVSSEHIDDYIEAAGSFEKLESEMERYGTYYDAKGHLGRGFYWEGVCCSDSLKALSNYFNRIAPKNGHNVIFVFEGEAIDSCTDGIVAKPTKIIAMLPVCVIEDKYLCEHL